MDFFSLKQMHYKPVLLFAMILFLITYHLEVFYLKIDSVLPFVVGYILSVLLAAFWATLNYIDHLRINPLYKHYVTIDSFVADLVISQDEKLEIHTMMIDFVADQQQAGKSAEEATKEIIHQFKLEEMQNQESNHFFFLHRHRYLLGNGLFLIALSLSFYLLNQFVFFSRSVIILEITLIAFGLGLWLSFLMYQLLNKILIKK